MGGFADLGDAGVTEGAGYDHTLGKYFASSGTWVIWVNQ
jgi:hypothetical protein